MGIATLLGLDGKMSDPEIMEKVDLATKNHIEEIELQDRKGRKITINIHDIKQISGQFLS
ncbi:MAG: hypothetical protein QW331_04290 [Candidatus Woesearchaeota archaeon]